LDTLEGKNQQGGDEHNGFVHTVQGHTASLVVGSWEEKKKSGIWGFWGFPRKFMGSGNGAESDGTPFHFRIFIIKRQNRGKEFTLSC